LTMTHSRQRGFFITTHSSHAQSDVFAFGLTANLSPKAWEDIFDPPPSPPSTHFTEFPGKCKWHIT
jgi:hypothetical protein